MNNKENAPAVGPSGWFEHETTICKKTGIRSTVFKNVPAYKGQLPDRYATESGPPIPEQGECEKT